MLKALQWFRHSDRNADAAKPAVELSVLTVGLSDGDLEQVRYAAGRLGCLAVASPRWETARQLCDASTFSVVLCDRDVQDVPWRDAVRMLTERRLPPAVLLVSAVNDEYLWREVVQQGGYGVVKKPFTDGTLTQEIDRAWIYRKSAAWAATVRK